VIIKDIKKRSLHEKENNPTKNLRLKSSQNDRKGAHLYSHPVLRILTENRR